MFLVLSGSVQEEFLNSGVTKQSKKGKVYQKNQIFCLYDVLTYEHDHCKPMVRFISVPLEGSKSSTKIMAIHQKDFTHVMPSNE